LTSILEAAGRYAIEKTEYVGGLTIQFWRGLRAIWKVNPITGSRLRWQNTVRTMAVVGFDALPVVCLIAGATGLIMAFQAGAELRRFGALQFVINLVARLLKIAGKSFIPGHSKTRFHLASCQ